MTDAGLTDAGLTDAGLCPAPLPYLGRTILLPALLAHGFALAGLAQGWSAYRSPWAALGLLAVSAALPVVLVVAPRRAGGLLPPWAAAVVLGGVLAVSTLLPALLPAADRSTWACWNWDTGAMTLLGLAVYLPPWRTVALAALHGGLAVATLVSSGEGAWGAHLAVVSATVPALGAAQYLHLYAAALRHRADTATIRAAAEADRHDLDLVRLADVRRLTALRERIEPLLQDVAERAPLPLDTERAGAARLLARQLRDALAAQRGSLWLPETVGAAPVSVIATDAATRAVGDDDRAWLAALLDLLGRHPGWHGLRVVVDLRLDGTATAVLTGDGPAARGAAGDPGVRALCARREARCDADDHLLVVEADLLTKIGA